MTRQYGLWSGQLAVAASLFVSSCGSDVHNAVENPPKEDASVADGSDSPPTDAGAPDPMYDDAGSGGDGTSGGDGSSDSDAGEPPPPPLSARCPLDESQLPEAAALWTNSFHFTHADEAGDDRGMGDYVYPRAALKGAADILSVDLDFDATDGTLSLSVGMAALQAETRVGVIMWDRQSFEREKTNHNIEWALSGTELRVPNWSRAGFATILAVPNTIVYDFTRKQGSATGSRADNAIFSQSVNFAGESDVWWFDCEGQPSQEATGIMELDVKVDRASDPETLTFSIPAKALSHEILTKDSAGGLAIVVYSFLVVTSGGSEAEDAMLNQYGAFEMTDVLGGITEASDPGKSWRDPDVYDIAFVEPEDGETYASMQEKQNDIMTTPEPLRTEALDSDEAFNKYCVVITDSSKGVGLVDTSGGGN